MAASDLLFILIAVPESLPERVRPASWGAPISWEQADPFAVSVNLLKFSKNILSYVAWLKAISVITPYSSTLFKLKKIRYR